MLGWFDRISEIVRRPRLNGRRHVRERMIVLAVELAAIRIDANLRFRELQRTAFPTFSADESGEHFLVAIEGGQRGLPVDFTAESVFQSHEVVESEILVVVRLFNAPCENPDTPICGRHLSILSATLNITASQP